MPDRMAESVVNMTAMFDALAKLSPDQRSILIERRSEQVVAEYQRARGSVRRPTQEEPGKSREGIP
jgi:hypothetical protein